MVVITSTFVDAVQKAVRSILKHHTIHIPMANMPTTDLLDGWEFERIDAPPFQRIVIKAPNGYTAVVDSMDRNPANILYMLADAILSNKK